MGKYSMSLDSRICSYRLFGIAVILLVLAIHSPARAGIGQWTNTGPFGGNVQALLVDPHNPATLYAAAPGGGVFKSVDGGTSWVPASNGIANHGVTALAIDPTTSTTLYAASVGFATFAGAPFPGGALFKSTDGAITWSQLPVDPTNLAPGGTDSTPPKAIAIDPQTPSTLYAASAGGVFKSVDGGVTWSMGTGLPQNGNFTAVIVDPQTPRTVYAGSTAGEVPGAGIFKSTDGGQSWAAINSGIPANPLNVLALAIDPQTPTILYASMLAMGGPGLYKSTNGGASWTLAKSGIGGPVAVDPQTTSTLYIGGGSSGFGIGSGVLKSTDGGMSFTPVNTGLSGGPVNVIAINPQTTATLYAGTANGVFATANAGAGWNAANAGLSLLSISALATDPTTPTTLYAGTVGNGMFKSLDGGGSWTAVDTGLAIANRLPGKITTLAIDPVTSSTLYLGDDSGEVFKSTDAGGNWAKSMTGITGGGGVVSLQIDPQTPATLYAGLFSAVYKSTNGGASWAPAQNGLPGIEVSGLSGAAPPASNIILALSTLGQGLFVSSNGATSWQPFDTSLPNTNSAPASPTDPNITSAQKACIDDMLASNMGAFFFRGGMGFKDGNEIWVACVSPDATVLPFPGGVQLTNGYSFFVDIKDLDTLVAPSPPGRNSLGPPLPAGVTVTPWASPDGADASSCGALGPIVPDPVDTTMFYTGGGCGVLRASNSGAQMVAMDLGLPLNLKVVALAITPSASDLYAGSQGGGVYRFTFADSPLAAAVLPSSRSVEVGTTATAFATIINASQGAASGCALAMSTSLPATFLYQTTNPATNALAGSPNTPVNIAAGSAQTFLFALTPTAAFNPIDAQLDFDCTGVTPVTVLPGINTLLISGSTTPVPDIIALVATASNDGILHIPGASGSGAFAVATDNLGAAAAITAAPVLSASSLPLVVTVCQTNPGSGQCLAPPAASVTATVNSGDTPTFGFFATASGAIPFDPVNSRISCQFTDANGVVHGSTSIAVATQ
jgi:photosystem II stability/assembly factor-like uncharacterized protein